MDWTTLATSDLPNLDAKGLGNFSLQQHRYGAPTAPPGTAAAPTTAVAATPTAPARPFEPLTDLIRRREQEIHQSILDRAQETIARRIRERREAGEQARWEEDRDRWLRSLSAPTAAAGTTETQQQHHQQIGYGSSATADTTSASSHLLLPAPPTQRSLQAQALIQEHHTIVRDQDPATTSATQYLRLFRTVACSQLPGLRSYVAAWDLVAQLLEATSTSGSSSGDQCRALLYCASQQFREHIVQRTGRRTSQLPLVEHCRWFQQQQQASGSNSGSQWNTTTTAITSNTSSTWPTLYFLLRCGDATAAAHVGCNDPVAQSVLESLARVQGTAKNLWDASVRMAATWKQQQQTQLVETTAVLVRSNTTDVYQVGVYKLLGLQEPIHSPVTEGFKEMKDYVYSALWTAYLGNTTNNEGLTDSIRTLGQQVLKEKPQDGAGGIDPWDYALSLMTTQHYGSALQWLAQPQHAPDGQFQAVHIALVLYHAGIPVADLGANDQLVPLLKQYAARLQDVVTAAAYLRHIPNEAVAAQAIGHLIAQGTSQDFLDRTVGHLDDHGNRLGGELNAVLSPNLISKSLVAAASFIAADAPTELDRKALQITCLTQAGKFPEAIQVMNRFISPPNVPDDQREYFLESVVAFQEKFLRPGNKIRSFLSTQPHLQALMDANLLLVQLNRFFTLCRAGDAGCAEHLYQLHLLPLQASDIPAMTQKYRQADPTCLQPVYPALLVAAMELLARDYQAMQRSGNSSKSLQERARVYMTFCDTVLVNVPHDVAAQLSLLRSRIL